MPTLTNPATAPTLTLRVGFVGHRFTAQPSRLKSTEAARLTPLLHEMFAGLMEAGRLLQRRHGAVFSSLPPKGRLVSSLASGADMIAQQALPEDWQSEIILPMPSIRFRQDYPETASADEPHTRALFDTELARFKARAGTRLLSLPDPGPDALSGYIGASELILANCDLLIAVWDGEEQNRPLGETKPGPALKPGGTAWTIWEALSRGIPVIWVDLATASARRVTRATEPSKLFAVEEVDCRVGPLGEMVEPIFAPPGSDGEEDSEKRPDRLADALQETVPASSLDIPYDAMVRLLTKRALRWRIPFSAPSTRINEWDTYLAGLPEPGGPLAMALKTVLLPRFARFDTLASVYAHRYRSAYVSVFLLSALAVFMGLLSLFHWPYLTEVNVKGVAASLEMVLIGTIIVIVEKGRRQRTHQRWLDYRGLAETLRHLRFVSMVGAASHAPRATSVLAAKAMSWQLWYARATIRELGLPTGTLDAAYCWQVLRQMRDHDLTEQLHYHHANHNFMHKVHKWLHHMGDNLFWGTAGILLVFYLLPWILTLPIRGTLFIGIEHPIQSYLEGVKPYISLFGAGLPALGGALAGIRVHGDFEGFALRSHYTAATLKHLMEELAAEQRQADLKGTTALLLACARVMSDDLEGWEALYGRKALVFPA